MRARLHREGPFVSRKKKIWIKERGMTSIKDLSILIEPFYGCGDFTLWQQRMKSLLTQERAIEALKVKTCRTERMTDDELVALREKDKPEKMSKEEGEDLKGMATSTILLCLSLIHI